MGLVNKILKTMQKTAVAGAVSLASCIDNFPDIVAGPTNPLVGSWYEKSAYSCFGERIIREGSERPIYGEPVIYSSEGAFDELVFRSDNTFTFTRNPFESYSDYWGTYDYNQENSALTMVVTGGNYVPSNLDLDGSVVFNDDGTVELDGVDFGSPRFSSGNLLERPCSYIIDRLE